MSKKILKIKYPTAKITKQAFGSYKFRVELDGYDLHFLTLNVNKNTILSINSKHIWQIKKGRVDGINFKTTSSTLIDMRSFNKLPNKNVVFKEKPYKILKYINENEVKDISTINEINEIKIHNSFKEIN